MKTEFIEQALRSAPTPQAPSQLATSLRAQIRLEPVACKPGASGWRRWWPLLAPAGTSLALAGIVTFQHIELRRLESGIQPRSGAGNVESSTGTGTAERINPGSAATASAPTTGATEVDPRVELERLRSEVNTMRASIAAASVLTTEGDRLAAEIAAAKAALPPDILAMSEAKERANRIRCVNNLKQLGLAVRLHAADNRGLFPADFKGMLPYTGTASILVCPADPTRPTSPEGNPVAASGSLESSYEYIAARASEADGENSRVCFVCQIHRNIALCDGSVQQLTLEQFARLVRRDGKTYFEPSNNAEPNPKP